MSKPFANSGDPDQMLHSAASDLGLHCMPITLFKSLQTTMGYGLRKHGKISQIREHLFIVEFVMIIFR